MNGKTETVSPQQSSHTRGISRGENKKVDNYPVMVTVVTAGVTVAATASIKAAL